ncbi:serpin B4 [Ictidomys tridecemlineatus]|uniref:serpin B4 n=1 Tax=Ictidomys tridecemlineatus TaxID=43179 RepID=UPI00038BB204|nr:serpin B4 [Ictidomys tridecemlineatus]KAG3293763.1 serpin B4, transcript variant X1 [Ictidomys tridecemlineatus]
MSSLSVANTKFTLDLFRKLRKDGDNVFYSPVSILSALAMLDLGARGNTALQMEKVLHFNEITEKATKKPTAPHAGESGNVHQEIQKFLTELNKPSEAYNLKIANRVYGEKEFQFLQEYLDGIKKFYLATVESLDFKNAAEESRKRINSWVESQTNEKIKDLFPSGTIDQNTRLVLVNAVYFKGRWDKEFKKEWTTEAKFWQNKNVSKSVQMMAKSGHFNFAFLEDVQAKILEMPYKGNDLSMVLLLPNEADGLQELEDKLTAEKLMEWTSPRSMEMTNVNVHLPRFKVEETYNLKTMLSAMGMEDVFCPQKADLSGMTGTQGLSVSKVVHKSFVEVNEEGTEAAATTGIVVKATSAPMPAISFYCDHPFLFFIKQNKTHSILFFGRVSSP